MTHGRDTKCLQVGLFPPGKENWPSDDHHHNNNLVFFVKNLIKNDSVKEKQTKQGEKQTQAGEPILRV